MSNLNQSYQATFSEILVQIQQTKQSTYQYANQNLIELYWLIGHILTTKIQQAQWGKSVVKDLARFIAEQDTSLKGFSDKNLWRMKQFYESYQSTPDLLPLVKELPWTHNFLIFSRCKTTEERLFYLELTIREKYTSRQLERQIDSASFERSMIGSQKLSAVLREIHPVAKRVFKDSYVLEFLGLPLLHSERSLQQALVSNMKGFILELGQDFIFIGQEYRLQVGNSDFFIDLLFFHRGLSALVAFELKVERFKPEHLGQLTFYLEALDRDVKKPHENPSIGVLLCSNKDDEVVEYALSRHLSPMMIAHYTTLLPNKQLLQAKLHELTQWLEMDQKLLTQHTDEE